MVVLPPAPPLIEVETGPLGKLNVSAAVPPLTLSMDENRNVLLPVERLSLPLGCRFQVVTALAPVKVSLPALPLRLVILEKLPTAGPLPLNPLALPLVRETLTALEKPL